MAPPVAKKQTIITMSKIIWQTWFYKSKSSAVYAHFQNEIMPGFMHVVLALSQDSALCQMTE